MASVLSSGAPLTAWELNGDALSLVNQTALRYIHSYATPSSIIEMTINVYTYSKSGQFNFLSRLPQRRVRYISNFTTLGVRMVLIDLYYGSVSDQALRVVPGDCRCEGRVLGV